MRGGAAVALNDLIGLDAARGFPRAAGHRAGLEAVRRIIEACRQYRVRVLTLYALSTENWRRPPDEVEALMRLLGEALVDELEDLMEAGVQFRMSGDLDTLEPALRKQVEQVVAVTHDNPNLVLNVAYNYGGRAEIIDAVRRLGRDLASGHIIPQAVDEAVVGRYP